MLLLAPAAALAAHRGACAKGARHHRAACAARKSPRVAAPAVATPQAMPLDFLLPPADPGLVPAFDTPASALAGVPVPFDGTPTTDSDGHPLVWAWTFGDGTTGGGQLVTHTYPAAGTYVAHLTILDDRGHLNDSSHAITVTSP